MRSPPDLRANPATTKQPKMAITGGGQGVTSAQSSKGTRNRVSRFLSHKHIRRLGIAVAGVLLGVVVQNVASGVIPVISVLSSLVALAILALLLSLQDNELRASSDRELAQQASEEAAVNISQSLSQFSTALEDVRRNRGLQVHFQSVDVLNSYNDMDCDIVSHAMAGAKRQILVVDVGSPHDAPGKGINPKLRRDHLQRLICLADRRPIEYRRIYQLQDPHRLDSSNLYTNDVILLDHCRKMVKLSDKYAVDDRISFGVLPRVFPYSWIIIDGETLVLELYRFKGNGKDPSYDGALVVRDPQGDLVGYFESKWRQLERECAHTLRLCDLPP